MSRPTSSGGVAASGVMKSNVIWQANSDGYVIVGGFSNASIYITENSNGGMFSSGSSQLLLNFNFVPTGGVFTSGLSISTIDHVAVIIYVKVHDPKILVIYDPVAPNVVPEPFPDIETIFVKKKQFSMPNATSLHKLKAPPPEPESGSVIIKR
jgi:hypothetical protein